ncbi:hypothetical protein ACFQ3S_00005 [Mucilaginibacter terrae]|uniref:hypothetical protein n=1 Tax=Mucilaginibacter terrae TaxID=1955052 RepID=UPI00362942C0
MKKIIFLIVALCAGSLSYGQKTLLSLNEQNQYTYFVVKPAPAQPNAQALAAYVKKAVTGVEFLEATNLGGVAGRGIVLVYKQGLITGQEEGQLAYNVKIDFKDNKYRLILTDFMFSPYQRNRYGVFALVNNSGIPLEKMGDKLSAKQLNSYLDKLVSYGAKFSQQVSDYLTNPAAIMANPAGLKKIDTKNW